MSSRLVVAIALSFAGLGALFRPAGAQLSLSVGPLASLVEHRVDIGGGVERSSGTLVGGTGSAEWRDVTVDGSLAFGELGAVSGGAETRTMSEARLGASRPLRSWLVLHAGTVTRRYSSTIAAQRWTIVRLGTEGRVSLFDGALSAATLIHFDPLVSVSGTRRPRLSIGARTSLTYSAGRLNVRLARSLERADFADLNSQPREEQVSMLSLGAGWRFR